MKSTTLLLIAALITASANADPNEQSGMSGQSTSDTQATDAAPHAPAPSRTLSEFLGRTVNTARLQAEEEVQYETRRQVNKAFNRLIGR